MAALPPQLTRRDCLVAGGLLLGAATRSDAASGAHADPPIADPAFNARLIGRLQGDLSGRQRWIHNPGFVFATVPGQGLAPAEFGRLLYRVEGFTSRISRLLPYRGGPSHSWLRPATGTAVDGATVGLESTGIGAPVRLSWRVLGDRAWLSRHAASRIRTPVGAVRNEFSMDAWVCRLDELRDERRSHLPATCTWTSQAEWRPWLRMDSRPGGLLWRIESLVLDDPAQLPADFATRMRELLPGKLEERLAW